MADHLILGTHTVRRVKCDEARPECLRCISTQRVCDGYLPLDPHVGSGAHPGASSIGIPTSTSAAITAGPSIDIHHACETSRRSFSFFIRRTSSQLAGFFGSEFWERLVPQAAHHESAIRHAVVAIGSLHEQKTVGRDSGVRFALEQYNLAIRALLAPLSQNKEQGVDICLMTCILFACFEVCMFPSLDRCLYVARLVSKQILLT